MTVYVITIEATNAGIISNAFFLQKGNELEQQVGTALDIGLRLASENLLEQLKLKATRLRNL